MTRDLRLDDDAIGTIDPDALRDALGAAARDHSHDTEQADAQSPEESIRRQIDLWLRSRRVVDLGQRDLEPGRDGDCLAAFIANACWEGGRFVFVLPEGTYRWTRPLFFTGGDGEYHEPIPEHIAVVGQPHATIHVDIESDDPMHRTMFRFGARGSPVPHVELHNFHVDVGGGDPDRDAGIMRANIRDRMHASGLSITQRCRLNPDGSRNGDRFTYKCDVVSESGVATHRDIDLTAGDTHRPSVNAVGHAIPFASEPNHEGVNRWIGCRVAGYTDNGFYVRNYSETGRNVLESCLARNCGGGNIRVGRNDAVRSCHIVVDGEEAPADGCGLWIENAKATTVDGVTIDAPAMDNDVVRVTGAISGASIQNLDVTLGKTGEYALKARGGYPGGHVACEGWTVRDACTGAVREASYSIHQPNVTFRDLDHYGTGGRIPFAFRSDGLAVQNSTIVTNGMLAARLGSVLKSNGVVDVRMDNVTFIDSGGGYRTAFSTYRDPELVRFALTDCDFRRADYGELLEDADLEADFESGRNEHCLGAP